MRICLTIKKEGGWLKLERREHKILTENTKKRSLFYFIVKESIFILEIRLKKRGIIFDLVKYIFGLTVYFSFIYLFNNFFVKLRPSSPGIITSKINRSKSIKLDTKRIQNQPE